jgi:hypothetical protein
VYTRECLAIEVGQSLKGHDVVRVLQQISQQRGVPQILFRDNGSEFTSPGDGPVALSGWMIFCVWITSNSPAAALRDDR